MATASGAQAINTPEFAAVLGHDFANQISVGYWADQIAAVSIGTSTAKTELGGTQIAGTGADYLLPTAARCIVAVRPKVIHSGLPTADEAILATLKVESGDLGIKDFEVLANPVDSGLGTNEMQLQDSAPWYPIMQPCNGGEKVQFYGTAQVANTVAPSMAVDVLLSSSWPTGYNGGAWTPKYGPVQAKVAGINYGGGPTSTGTAATTPAVDGGVTISGPRRRLIGVVGAVVGTTPAAQKGISGQFLVNASELSVNPIRFNAEPILGFLGTTTTAALAHLSKMVGINLDLNAPSTPKSSFSLDAAITTLGHFETGYIYIDNP